jgi:predicted transcriptional regulator
MHFVPSEAFFLSQGSALGLWYVWDYIPKSRAIGAARGNLAPKHSERFDSAHGDRSGRCFKKGPLCTALQPRLTRAFVTRTLKAMEVLLPENREAQLNEIALRTGRGTDDLIQEAVARMLAQNAWFKEQLQIGIDQIMRGEFIEEDAMDARIKRMLES